MAAEQLTLLDLAPQATGPRPTRPRARQAGPAKPAIAALSGARSGDLVAGEVVIEHRYPQALEFLREHGPDAVAVLHVLVAQAEPVDGRLVAAASTRGVAERLGFDRTDGPAHLRGPPRRHRHHRHPPLPLKERPVTEPTRAQASQRSTDECTQTCGRRL
jgi:hypothetical protein